MKAISNALQLRYALLTWPVVLTLSGLVLLVLLPGWRWLVGPLLVPCAVIAAMALRDVTQTKHAVLRNYPVSARLRFLLEGIRPEMRQYFFEDDKDGTPFARDKRAIVYQRAKRELETRPFGTQYDVYREQ